MQKLLADLPVKIYRRHTCETQFDLGLRGLALQKLFRLYAAIASFNVFERA
jgi:hypothetical protein